MDLGWGVLGPESKQGWQVVVQGAVGVGGACDVHMQLFTYAQGCPRAVMRMPIVIEGLRV